MPIFIIIVGALLIAAGLNDKLTDLGGLIKEDFKPTDGSPSFPVWAVAIVIVGALGYNKTLRPVSYALLAFIIVVIFVRRDDGFIDKFFSALKG